MKSQRSQFCSHAARRCLREPSGRLPQRHHQCLSLSALQLKTTGSICRPKSGDCDLEEYCTGFSASCPTDAFTQNGLACNRGRGYCYNGQCPSRQQHCRRLWGPGKSSPVLPAADALRRFLTLTLAAVWFVSPFRGRSRCGRLLPPTRKLQEDVVQPEMLEPVIHGTTKISFRRDVVCVRLIVLGVFFFQGSVLRETFLLWGVGVSDHFQEVFLHIGTGKSVQRGGDEPRGQLPSRPEHGAYWHQVWHQYGQGRELQRLASGTPPPPPMLTIVTCFRCATINGVKISKASKRTEQRNASANAATAG